MAAPIVLMDQTARHSKGRFVAIFAVLQLLLFIAFVDQFCVSTVLPDIATALNASTSISWVGTAAIVTTIGSQMIVVRCSDIFGRREALTAILLLYIMGNLLCGFAQNPIWLYTCRGVSGVGAGGIISLTMVCVADLVPARERGQWQGFTGLTVALGSGLGPLIGAAMATVSWRWAFWITPPVLALSLPLLYIVLPGGTRPTGETVLDQLRKCDYLGSFLIFASSLLVLVPLSGGGTLFPWKSAACIVLLVLGVLVALMFLAVERWYARLPILPTRLFHSKSVNLILIATTTQGWIYYGTLYFIPLFLQEVQGYTPLGSAVLLLPMVFSQALSLALAGRIATVTGHNVPQMQVGYGLCLVAMGLLYRFNQYTSKGEVVGVLFLTGFSAGLTLQTSLVSMQNTAPDDLRAVITGARNMFRSLGGSIALAACGTIRNSVTSNALSSITGLTAAQRESIISSGPGTTAANDVRAAVGTGVHAVFISFLPLIAISFLVAIFIPQQKLANLQVIQSKNGARPSDTENAIKADTAQDPGDRGFADETKESFSDRKDQESKAIT